jgi:hypothetical protein
MTTLEFSQLLGNYGEFVGAIAIVVTLAYLAMQVKQAKMVVVEQARSARLQSDMDLLLFNAGNTILPSAIAKVFAQDGMSDSKDNYVGNLIERYGFEIKEAVQMQAWCFAWLKRLEITFLQPLDKDERLMLGAQISQFSNWPWCDKFWDEQSHQVMFDKRFASYVDGLFAE